MHMGALAGRIHALRTTSFRAMAGELKALIGIRRPFPMLMQRTADAALAPEFGRC